MIEADQWTNRLQDRQIPMILRRRALFLSSWIPCLLIAQSDMCDPQLKGKVDPQNPYAYRLRDDRCEGIFIKDVAGGGLLLASLTASIEAFQPASVNHVEIHWEALTDRTIQIRAYSLRQHLYYRMDTRQSNGASRYMWPTGVLAGTDLKPPDLGVVAWTPYSMGSTTGNLYIPVSIGKGAGVRPGVYRLVFVFPVELSEIYLTVARVGADSHLEQPLRDATPLKYGYYPANRGCAVEVPAPPKPGVYFVEASADILTGGKSSIQFWFYQAK